jgi:alkylated DNA repair dioxygenase AlkB
MCPQASLFEAAPSDLVGGVTYFPDFIGVAAIELFASLLNLKWEQHDYVRTGITPRKSLWMGIPYTSPRLANKVAVIEWTPEAKRIKALVEEKTGCRFDSLNLNLYRNHRDSIDWHYDGEQEALGTFPIASVSLGAARRFKWRRNKDWLITTQLLVPGSLLVMPPGFQRDYYHALPKQTKVCGPRINLTFRRTVA